MIITTRQRPALARAAAWGLAFSALWLAVGWLRPDSTFHLAPILVAGAPPLLLALDDRAGATPRTVAVAAAIGAILAAVTLVLLVAVGRTEGPVFEPFTSVVAESVVFIVVGAGLGWLFGSLRVR